MTLLGFVFFLKSLEVIFTLFVGFGVEGWIWFIFGTPFFGLIFLGFLSVKMSLSKISLSV